MTDGAAAPREVVLVGANPGARLFVGDDVSAFASVWDVRWSLRGRGRAIVLWHDGQVRVVGDDLFLADWLTASFTRHFPEVAGLPWPEPQLDRADVHLDVDLGHGVAARAGDVAVTMAGLLDRRTFTTDAFDLGGVRHGLSLVLAPAQRAEITLGGHRLPGEVRLGGTSQRPTSSAFVADAEVWWR